MKNLFDRKVSIWLIDAIDLVAIQKLNVLPHIDPMRQVGRMCVAMGMGKIRLIPSTIHIGGMDMMGCMILSNGFDIVPFIAGVYPDKSLSEKDFDLSSIYDELEAKEEDDEKTYN